MYWLSDKCRQETGGPDLWGRRLNSELRLWVGLVWISKNRYSSFVRDMTLPVHPRSSVFVVSPYRIITSVRNWLRWRLKKVFVPSLLLSSIHGLEFLGNDVEHLLHPSGQRSWVCSAMKHWAESLPSSVSIWCRGNCHSRKLRCYPKTASLSVCAGSWETYDFQLRASLEHESS